MNNAATNPFYGSVLEVDEQAWNKTLELNLKGPFFIVRVYATTAHPSNKQNFYKSGSNNRFALRR